MSIFDRMLSASLFSVLTGCAQTPDSPETAVCGPVKEPLVFAIWSRLAGEPAPSAALGVPNAEAMAYRTKDDRLLMGYKLGSTAPGHAVVGKMLVAQGNAMLSDRLLSSLTGFSEAGIEVYIFDYRGYGNSEGRRRLKAMISDYREIASALMPPSEGKRFFYGISFGGIVVLNAIGAGVDYDLAIIDSTPSRISDRGCPLQYDPAENLPSDASRLLLIAGQKDIVVPAEQSEELIARAKAAGARTEVRHDYAHPFMDPDRATMQARLDLIRSFLLQSDPRTVGTACTGAPQSPSC